MVMLTSFPAPTDGIKHEQPRTKLFVIDQEFGIGTLYITESKLTWINNDGEGISFLYPQISVHAVSRDVQQYGAECLIVVLDTCLEGADENREEDNDEDMATELRFVPEDKDQLDAMYRAMTFCQTQHPDPNDSFSDLSEEDAFYEDADDERNVLAGGDSEYTNGIDEYFRLNMNGLRINPDEEMEDDGQFEDADD
ncbi:methylosome subunit pICln-like [Macrosteles quadrilineatus]|uniref:methylosome subunit pICln-like n=1 Tax=Macrosteles quadrilineatus TaxID=74068 RepID=UPI0023E1CBE4|nr:methylosome subunit pICln-like [Macrosteles quadrilineatus]